MNNIVFTMMDQLRFDALGHSGEFPLRTPGIDALVASGTSFENAIPGQRFMLKKGDVK